MSVDGGGIFTDHGPDHFDAVIRYAGKLLAAPIEPDVNCKLDISPYEIFALLVSILLHDAGNIYGRSGHEKQALAIYQGMGPGLCPDVFEARIIASIAKAHGGYVKLADGSESKDTIKNLLIEKDTIASVEIRPKAIAALLRFADEICEDRSRAARMLLVEKKLPRESEVFHAYANSISSVDVDLRGKSVNLKYELKKENVLRRYGKGGNEVFLIDEIFSRLEKMQSEMIYCQRFMSGIVRLEQVRATIYVYQDDLEEVLKEKAFELKESGYTPTGSNLAEAHPDWVGAKLKIEMEGAI